MSSPLLPFNANIPTADGSPYLLKMSKGMNETIFFGSGLPQDQQLAARIEGMMAACNGKVNLADPGDAFIARLMALSWHIEYLTTALMGSAVTIDDQQSFLASLGNLSGELVRLDQHPQLGGWVKQRLQDAQFRHFQQFGQREQATTPPGPQSHRQMSPWNSSPNQHAAM